MQPKAPSVKIVSVYGCIILLLLFLSLFLTGDDNYNKLSLTSISYAHLSHLPHYNGFGAAIGKYYVDEALDPEFTPPLEPTQITFSIQDYGGNDVYNVYTMVEIYQDIYRATNKGLSLDKTGHWGLFALLYIPQDRQL